MRCVLSRPPLNSATFHHAAYVDSGLVRLHGRRGNVERGRQPRGVPRHGTERHERVVAATLPADIQ